MHQHSLAQGWTVAPKQGAFDGTSAPPPVEVTLPHDAMIDAPRDAGAPAGAHSGYFPGGVVEYVRQLDLPESAVDDVHRLVFDGVHRDAMVYINDDFAGRSRSGYARFVVDADPFLRFGSTNTIRVEARAHRDSRWYTGLGIHRNVWLHTGPRVHLPVDGVRITTPEVDRETALVEVEIAVVNGHARPVTARVEVVLRGPDGGTVAIDSVPITLVGGETGTVRRRLHIDRPALWSPAEPGLHTYSVRVHAGETEDAQTGTFGVRRLQLDPRHGLRINGEPVKLRGACIHHDNGIIGARSIARAEERRIERLKAAGFNAIRGAHNPISPELLDACDRLGMLVMDELFDVWTESKTPFDGSLDFPDTWEREVEQMVAKDFNHPSVIFYSIGNEITEVARPLGARRGRLIAESLHRLDPTRFTTNSVNPVFAVMNEIPPPDPEQLKTGNDALASMVEFLDGLTSSELVSTRTEEAFAFVDAAGLNYGDGRYAIEAERFPNRVGIGTETFSTRIDLNWPKILELDHVIGDFTWTGWDYLGEAGIGRIDYSSDVFPGSTGAFPWMLAWAGDLDITGFRRPASYFREIVFGRRGAPYLAVQRPHAPEEAPHGGPWSWEDAVSSWSWPVELGTPMVVSVYSADDEVELELNGRSLGTQPAGRPHRYRASFTVPYEPGRLVAIARADGRETERFELTTAEGPLSVTARPDRDVIGSTPDDLAFIDIELSSSSGIVPVGADRAFRVTVDGPAVALGVGSARPATHETFDPGTEHTLFDGRAQAVIRPTGPGVVTIRVEADGCEPTSCAFRVEDVRSIAPVGRMGGPSGE